MVPSVLVEITRKQPDLSRPAGCVNGLVVFVWDAKLLQDILWKSARPRRASGTICGENGITGYTILGEMALAFCHIK